MESHFRRELLKRAEEVREKAYAPYSKFEVGAALLTRSGKIFTGTNVENASFGLTICAERVALFTAVSAGERDFEALALSLPKEGIPCGACLQVLSEFSEDLLLIIRGRENGKEREWTLRNLLPEHFRLKSP